MKINDLVRLGHELDRAQNAAFDLWTWLPSYKTAEKYHGDYGSEFTPSLDDIMKEACEYISHLKSTDKTLSETQNFWFNECPCGEPHDGPVA